MTIQPVKPHRAKEGLAKLNRPSPLRSEAFSSQSIKANPSCKVHAMPAHKASQARMGRLIRRILFWPVNQPTFFIFLLPMLTHGTYLSATVCGLHVGPQPTPQVDQWTRSVLIGQCWHQQGPLLTSVNLTPLVMSWLQHATWHALMLQHVTTMSFLFQ